MNNWGGGSNVKNINAKNCFKQKGKNAKMTH